jgi:hypothetical protein
MLHEFCNQNKLEYVECSAKDGTGLRTAFELTATKLVARQNRYTF